MAANRVGFGVGGAIVVAAALACLALLLGSGRTTETADAAAGKRPQGARVLATGVRAIKFGWRRVRGARRYEVQVRGPGRKGKVRVSGRKRSIKLRRLKRGSRYVLRVRACRGRRCGGFSPKRAAATLYAPNNGPHGALNCQVLPPSSEFHRDVSGAALHPRSNQIISRINSMGDENLHPDFGSQQQWGIPYVVVPANQPKVPIKFTAYGSESDKGPYPIPPGAPIEGTASGDGDRHVIAVQRAKRNGGACRLYELYRAFPRKRGWAGDSGAAFNLSRGLPQRPEGWTSADAAGLPIFPGLVTYEEVQAGFINHAIRVTFEQTRRAYIHPASHWASESCHPSDPPMGLRLRLRAGYPIGHMSAPAQVIATALKRYGMIVADNGSNWFISGATDRRWRDDPLGDLKEIPGTAFEVVTSPGRKSVDDC